MDVRERRLKVSSLHEIQIYEFGNPAGVPVVFFHGGPGSGIVQSHFDLFNADTQRVFLFDQRGCGKSTPRASLVENTTMNLVADAELIRKEYGIDNWYVVGGSWGSTLGLVYAGLNAKVVRGGVFWAITEYAPEEISTMCEVFPIYFPEKWDAYREQGGAQHPSEIIKFELNEMNSGSEERRQKSVIRSNSLWINGLTLEDKTGNDFGANETLSLFFYNYATNSAYLAPEQRPSALGPNLAGKPIVILNGRQDMRCFPMTAYKVHKSIPGSKLKIVSPAGHGSMDKSMSAEIRRTLNEVLI